MTRRELEAMRAATAETVAAAGFMAGILAAGRADGMALRARELRNRLAAPGHRVGDDISLRQCRLCNRHVFNRFRTGAGHQRE